MSFPHERAAAHSGDGRPAPLAPPRPPVPAAEKGAPGPIAHQAALQGDTVDLDGEIAAALQAFADTAATTWVRIESASRTRHVSVRADRARIRQLLVSLIAEALDIAPPRGIVRVSAAIDEYGDPTMEVAVTANASRDASARPDCRREGPGPRFWESAPGLGLARALAESLGGRLSLGDPAEGWPIVRVCLPRFGGLSRPQA